MTSILVGVGLWWLSGAMMLAFLAYVDDPIRWRIKTEIRKKPVTGTTILLLAAIPATPVFIVYALFVGVREAIQGGRRR